MIEEFSKNIDKILASDWEIRKVKNIISDIYPDMLLLKEYGFPWKKIIEIVNNNDKGFKLSRNTFYDFLKKESKKNTGSNSNDKKSYSPALPKTTLSDSSTFMITGEDELGNIFTDDPEAPFGRDRYCFPYHRIQGDELDVLVNKGFSVSDSCLLLKYNINNVDLFGSNLPLKAKIHPAIQNRIESLRKEFSVKNIRIIKSKYKDIIK